jgi:hypothetical protein
MPPLGDKEGPPMRKLACASLCLALITGLLASGAWAVERELAGVRLGDKSLDLLDRPGFGEPNFIGPLGTLAYVAPQQQPSQASAAGPVGPSAAVGASAGMRGGGMRAGGMRAGGMRGGGMRGGGMRGGGMRGGGMPGGGMRGGGMRGGAAGGGMRTGAVGGRAGGARAAAPGASSVAGPGMYWYYRRPGGATLLLTLTQTGQVTAITLTGRALYVRGRTTRGIGLTSSYMELISQYGYPDQIVTGGTVLELTYVDHGVRFTLDNMQVTEISIGPHIARAFQPEVEVAPEEALPPAGLSVEELRGYL